MQHIAGVVSWNQRSDTQKRPLSPLSVCSPGEEDRVTACNSLWAVSREYCSGKTHELEPGKLCSNLGSATYFNSNSSPSVSIGTRLSISHNDDLI